MQHECAPGDGLLRHAGVCEVALDKLDARRNVLPQSRRKVIGHANALAPADELLDEM